MRGNRQDFVVKEIPKSRLKTAKIQQRRDGREEKREAGGEKVSGRVSLTGSIEVRL